LTPAPGEFDPIDENEEVILLTGNRRASSSSTKGNAVIPVGASDSYTVEFENIYDPADTDYPVNGKVTLEGRDLKDGEFVFEIYQADDGSFDISGKQPIETVNNGAPDGSGHGPFSFADIQLDKVGTYYYVVTQNEDANLPGITYDPNDRFLITITVTDEDGELKAIVTVTDASGRTASEIIFNNKYSYKGVSVDFIGKKLLKGATIQSSMFAFKLYTADDEYDITNEGLRPEKTVSNDGSGRFEFKDIKFTAPGTYYYLIEEDCTNKRDNITYDETQFGIEVDVTDNGRGQLEADVTICEIGGGEVDKIVFENVYVDPSGGGDDDDDDDDYDDDDGNTDIIISKEVYDKDGNKCDPPEGTEFKVTVDLGDDYAGMTVKTSEGSKRVDEDGLLYFTIDTKTPVRIYGIDEGTDVKTWVDLPGGFTPIYTSKQFIVGDGPNYVVFKSQLGGGGTGPVPPVPGQPGQPVKPGDPSQPDTGDHSRPELYLGAMAASAVGLALLIFTGKRGKKKKDE